MPSKIRGYQKDIERADIDETAMVCEYLAELLPYHVYPTSVVVPGFCSLPQSNISINGFLLGLREGHLVCNKRWLPLTDDNIIKSQILKAMWHCRVVTNCMSCPFGSYRAD